MFTEHLRYRCARGAFFLSVGGNLPTDFALLILALTSQALAPHSTSWYSDYSFLSRWVSHFVSLTFYIYYTTDHWVCQGFFKIFLAIFPLWREGCHPNELLFSVLHSRSSHVFFYKVIRNSLVFYFREDFLTPSSLSYIPIIACIFQIVKCFFHFFIFFVGLVIQAPPYTVLRRTSLRYGQGW